MVDKLRLEELHRLSVEEFKKVKKTPVVVVLDNIRSAMNVGSFFRTCDAFAIEKLYLCGFTAQPPHKEITKTAIGATESVEWIWQENAVLLATSLKEMGYHLIGVEQTNNSQYLEAFQELPPQKLALFFGNEVDGLSADLLPEMDTFAEIQQFGTKHSLNVSVCGGIVIHHFSSLFRHL